VSSTVVSIAEIRVCRLGEPVARGDVSRVARRTRTEATAARESKQRTSTVDELGARISSAIMTGELSVGTWLRQETLAERFGVSRQPVREALRQLQASGMVEVFPNRGAVVRGPSRRDIEGAYVVRAELEGLAAELATTRISPEGLARLREAEEAFRRAVEERLDGAKRDHVDGDHGWGHANDVFHETILDAADVPLLAETIRAVHKTIPRNLTWSAIRTRALLTENIRQHEAVREALEAGDAVAARRAMTDHVHRSGELIAAWFSRRQAEESREDTGR
jgi:DNA-binding GntR family transcriptional regulator